MRHRVLSGLGRIRSRGTAAFATVVAVAAALTLLAVGGCGDSSATAPTSYAMTVTMQPDARTVAAGDSVTLDFVVRAVTAGSLPLALDFAFDMPVGFTPRMPPCEPYGPKRAWLLGISYGDYANCRATVVVAPTATPGMHTLTVVASAKGFSEARATLALTVTAAR